ncbi:MAG: hypothetical protein IBX55_21735 [Methyloprofundus sp.]|nr:hypothetical protein [Methyloprofundus sp.]
MIPQLIDIEQAPWCVLPPGVHTATLAEVKSVFAQNHHRRKLFLGLLNAANALHVAGCKYLYLDGSYVTAKPNPSDFDCCWNPEGVKISLLDPVFLDFSNARQNQKNKFLGELFPFNFDAAPGKKFLDFFQVEKYSGGQKGIIVIDLTTESFTQLEEGFHDLY